MNANALTHNMLPESDGGLSAYLNEIKQFPVLEEEEEYMLAKRWAEHGDYEAAHKLITSHLRLVAKIAGSYRGYGLSHMDLIAEGNIGLMQAVKKFEPDLGYRLSTYAMWWIKASMQEFILRSWSLVKMGTSASQKKLFFNLRKVKRQIDAVGHNLTKEELGHIVKELNVSERDVLEMDMRMGANDQFLNQKIGDDDNNEWIDVLEDETANQELILSQKQEEEHRKSILGRAMSALSEREQSIIKMRRLREVPATLEELSQKYNISRERVRQIETRAIEKLSALMLEYKPQSS
jgi:RNA polymerase sigma-32 factor